MITTTPRISMLLALVLFCMTTTSASACNTDLDCKGDRVCDEGICRAPGDAAYRNVCTWTGEVDPGFTPGLESNEAKQIVERIADSVSYQLPVVKTGPVTSAAAMIYNRQRLIVFNPTYLSDLRARAGEWGVLFVFAHEIGHHVNGDVWREGDNSALVGEEAGREIAADRFATRVLVKLGASLEDCLGAFSAFPVAVGVDQPDAQAREAAVRAEYEIELARRAARCTTEQELLRGVCVPRCPGGRRTDGACEQVCGEDELLEGGLCRPKCRLGESWDGASCKSTCGSGQRWNGSDCEAVCESNERWNGSGCESRCDEDERWDGGSCVDRCDDGERWDGSSCVSQCDDEERWDGSSCVARCDDDQRWTGSRCRARCPAHELWNGSFCAPRCAGNQSWNGSSCQSNGYPTGHVILTCGCHGYVNFGASRPSQVCASGVEVAVTCQAFCPMGGYQWGIVCQ